MGVFSEVQGVLLCQATHAPFAPHNVFRLYPLAAVRTSRAQCLRAVPVTFSSFGICLMKDGCDFYIKWQRHQLIHIEEQ